MLLPKDFSNNPMQVGTIQKVVILDGTSAVVNDEAVENACIVQVIAESDCRFITGLDAEATLENSIPLAEGISREYFLKAGDNVSVISGICTVVYMW